jgi:peroxiredoxin Q/BCP
VILGASPDPVDRQARFRKKLALPFTLLADVDHTVAEAYGVWQLKTTMGLARMGIVRSTVIIDPRGNVARAFDKVSAAGHAALVEEALRALQHTGTE